MEIFYIKAVINIIGMLIGTFFVYLGYQLYLKNVVEKGHVEAQFENWKVALKGYGPGVLFAICGAVLVVVSVNRGFEFKETVTKRETVKRQMPESGNGLMNETSGSDEVVDEVTTQTEIHAEAMEEAIE